MGDKILVQKRPDQPGDVTFNCADISKAKTLPGYNPHIEIA